MSADTQTPAFPPMPYISEDSRGRPTGQAFAHGMSLRDYFAAAVMPATIAAEQAARGNLINPGTFDFPLMAETAYRMADAMLEQRSKQ